MVHILVVSPPIKDMVELPANKSCVLLGLPFDMTNEDFSCFLEPYADQLTKCFLVRTIDCKCHCIVSFVDAVSFLLSMI